jgi:hypothetical protein
MRSQAARLVFGAAAWLAIVAAAGVLVTLERRTTAARETFRAFDEAAQSATDTLADLRVGLQAYVATGQGVGFWMPKVGATMDAAAGDLTSLRRAASTPDAIAAVDEASGAITDLRSIDGRARDYLQNMQPLMAGDVVFTEGEQTTVQAVRAVERARTAERAAVDAVEASNRRVEIAAIGIAGALSALAVLVLLPAGAEREVATAAAVEPAARTLAPPPLPVARKAHPLAKVASLCTDYGRVRDVEELERLLGRTAELMEASGIIVWIGDTAGGDLSPALTHGYPAGMLERLPKVPRAADNAAAAAYRTGTMQIVLAKSAGTTGAIVAPVLAPDGCIGALSAEMKGGAEGSDQNQAVAALVAAHLATVLAPAETPAAESSAEGQPKSAVG